MRMNLPCLLKVAFLLVPALCLAHGELKPGPHGGEIRMPGAFHVEVIARSVTVDVYLLDMQFENPQIADSSVNVTLQRDEDQLALECQVVNNKKMFRGLLPNNEELGAGRLLVNATRGGLPAEPMHYELPLKSSDMAPASE
jgi:hypothetical protein